MKLSEKLVKMLENDGDSKARLDLLLIELRKTSERVDVTSDVIRSIKTDLMNSFIAISTSDRSSPLVSVHERSTSMDTQTTQRHAPIHDSIDKLTADPSVPDYASQHNEASVKLLHDAVLELIDSSVENAVDLVELLRKDDNHVEYEAILSPQGEETHQNKSTRSDKILETISLPTIVNNDRIKKAVLNAMLIISDFDASNSDLTERAKFKKQVCGKVSLVLKDEIVRSKRMEYNALITKESSILDKAEKRLNMFNTGLAFVKNHADPATSVQFLENCTSLSVTNTRSIENQKKLCIAIKAKQAGIENGESVECISTLNDAVQKCYDTRKSLEKEAGTVIQKILHNLTDPVNAPIRDILLSSMFLAEEVQKITQDFEDKNKQSTGIFRKIEAALKTLAHISTRGYLFATPKATDEQPKPKDKPVASEQPKDKPVASEQPKAKPVASEQPKAKPVASEQPVEQALFLKETEASNIIDSINYLIQRIDGEKIAQYKTELEQTLLRTALDNQQELYNSLNPENRSKLLGLISNIESKNENTQETVHGKLVELFASLSNPTAATEPATDEQPKAKPVAIEQAKPKAKPPLATSEPSVKRKEENRDASELLLEAQKELVGMDILDTQGREKLEERIQEHAKLVYPGFKLPKNHNSPEFNKENLQNISQNFANSVTILMSTMQMIRDNEAEAPVLPGKEDLKKAQLDKYENEFNRCLQSCTSILDALNEFMKEKYNESIVPTLEHNANKLFTALTTTDLGIKFLGHLSKAQIVPFARSLFSETAADFIIDIHSGLCKASRMMNNNPELGKVHINDKEGISKIISKMQDLIFGTSEESVFPKDKFSDEVIAVVSKAINCSLTHEHLVERMQTIQRLDPKEQSNYLSKFTPKGMMEQQNTEEGLKTEAQQSDLYTLSPEKEKEQQSWSNWAYEWGMSPIRAALHPLTTASNAYGRITGRSQDAVPTPKSTEEYNSVLGNGPGHEPEPTVSSTFDSTKAPAQGSSLTTDSIKQGATKGEDKSFGEDLLDKAHHF